MIEQYRPRPIASDDLRERARRLSALRPATDAPAERLLGTVPLPAGRLLTALWLSWPGCGDGCLSLQWQGRKRDWRNELRIRGFDLTAFAALVAGALDLALQEAGD